MVQDIKGERNEQLCPSIFIGSDLSMAHSGHVLSIRTHTAPMCHNESLA